VTGPVLTRRRSSGLVVAALCASGMVVAVQQTVVVPLLPDLPRVLGAPPEDVSWIVTVTLLTSAVATPIVSRLADMFGKRRMFLLCMAVMVVGSLTAALAPGLPVLVVGRALQGLGLALIPVGISILRDEVPAERMAGSVALMSATLGIGAATGPPLAGVLYEHLGWHSVFWTSAGAGLVLLVAVALVVPESPIRTGGRVDHVGAALLSVALVCLLLALTKAASWGVGSVRILSLVAVGGVLLALWVPWELGAARPLVDLRVSARRPVLFTNLASLMVGFAMYANMLTTTQQLQLPEASGHGFGENAAAAGLWMLPAGVTMVAMAPLSAAVTRRFGARITLVSGALVMAVGYAGRALWMGELWQVVVGAVVVAGGTAVGYAAMPILIMGAVPVTETASANGLNALLRALGTAVSSATVGVVLGALTVAVGGEAVASLAAFRWIFLVAGGASLVALGLALTIPRAR
jgi:MFS family permease